MSELAKALAKAQGEMGSAPKDAQNPHFRSSYATLASSIDAAKKALSDNGLSVVQFGSVEASGDPVLYTRLLHISGEFIEGIIPLILVKKDMQGLGSAWTYARRYGFQAIIGMAQDDDDGNGSISSNKIPLKPKQEEPPWPTTNDTSPTQSEFSPRNLAQDAKLTKPPSMVIGFGKNKGKSLKEVDDGYLDWLIANLKNPDRKYPIKESEKELLYAAEVEKQERIAAGPPQIDLTEEIPF